MKTILIIIAVAVAAIQNVARAAEEPAWSLEGRSISADSCGVDCPCNIGGPPHNGECRFIQIRQVDKGRYGDVKLDGVKFGMAGQFTREVTGGPTKFSFVAHVAGKPFITITYVWRADNDVEPTWPVGHCKWLLDIQGEPSLSTEMTLATTVDAKRPTSITVAMHGLNAIPAVCGAPPGFATHLTLPVFGGRGAASLQL